jgi:hypothetical protein
VVGQEPRGLLAETDMLTMFAITFTYYQIEIYGRKHWLILKYRDILKTYIFWDITLCSPQEHLDTIISVKNGTRKKAS